MPSPIGFSKDFPLDTGIFKTAKLTLDGATDANAFKATSRNRATSASACSSPESVGGG